MKIETRQWAPPPPKEAVQYARDDCAGCGRPLPLRVFKEAADFFMALRAKGVEVPPDLTVASSQCAKCGSYTVLTARALRFTN